MNLKDFKEFLSSNNTLSRILRGASDPENARKRIHDFVEKQWQKINSFPEPIHPLEFDIQMQGLRTLRKITSHRSINLTDFDSVGVLFRILVKNEIPPDVSRDFLLEITHLMRAINGESRIYDDQKAPAFLKLKGKKASASRSRHLDRTAERYEIFTSRYKCGLDSDVIRKREGNRKRIIKALKSDKPDWNDYRWQLKNVIRDAGTLERLLKISPEEKTAIIKARSIKIPFGITPYYLSLMDNDTSRAWDHAVRAQVMPPLHYVETMGKNRGKAEHTSDFMMERDTSPVDLVTRRYPFIAIFKPFNTCSQICVYCQRNWEIDDVMSLKAAAPRKKLEEAYRWFSDNKKINEVLITGGDPFVMSDSRIEEILERFSKMKHISKIRFGTRTPVVLPQRITGKLADIIKKYTIPGKRSISIVTHYEHSYEITPESMKAVQTFRKRGISVYNQAVFTIENSRRFELSFLREKLRLIGVDNYYTFNAKGKEETDDYRVPIARLQQELKEEARICPGLTRTDEAVYNVPKLGKNYIRAGQHHSLLNILPDGRRVYEFHPWEKYLSFVDTYIDIDVSIYGYLRKLKKRGESPEDYKSIWYYY